MQMSGKSSSEEVSLYFHIPFCRKKCHYCHFYIVPHQKNFEEQLMRSFEIEWNQKKEMLANKQIVSIYFGGGTPSLIDPSALRKILGWVQPELDCEITLEANPEDLSKERAKEFFQSGINRLSIGVQTLSNSLLEKIGRLHSADRAENAVQDAFRAGFKNISIDLMYDLPMQTLDDWKSTLEQASQLPITHLSLYNLTIEPHTLFFKQKKELTKQLPSDDLSLQMYNQAVETLENYRLSQYEISAFARDDKRSRHNSGYWSNRSFLGFGPSAFSYWQQKRFQNIANINRYSQLLDEGKDPVNFSEKLSDQERLNEQLVLGLRLKEGVLLSNSKNKSDINRLIDDGLLIIEENFLRLTSKGIRFYDTVASELI